MTDYSELVKALRCREAEWGYYTKCEYYGEASDNRCVRCDSDRLAKDAAAAIEELSKTVKDLTTKVECSPMQISGKAFDRAIEAWNEKARKAVQE